MKVIGLFAVSETGSRWRSIVLNALNYDMLDDVYQDDSHRVTYDFKDVEGTLLVSYPENKQWISAGHETYDAHILFVSGTNDDDNMSLILSQNPYSGIRFVVIIDYAPCEISRKRYSRRYGTEHIFMFVTPITLSAKISLEAEYLSLIETIEKWMESDEL